MKNLERCLQRNNFTQDKFQTSICWMLLAGAVLATIPPIVVAFISQSDPGCVGTDFTIYAHYSTHQWLTAKFNEFKASQLAKAEAAGTTDTTCYELRIEDSTLAGGAKPTIWIPETEIWIDLADATLREQKDKLNDGKLVKDRDTDCKKITSIPFGIITWSKFAKFLLNFPSPASLEPFETPTDAASYTITFEDIITLAEVGWQKYNKTNETIDAYFPDEEIDDLYFAHGHPNVTSGGLLGFVTAYSTYAASPPNVFAFDSGPPDCDTSASAFDDIEKHIEALENRVFTTTPIDYYLPQLMKSKGPTYLHMAFGFENDVAYFNNLYREKLLYLWGDTLSFLYLKNTYWLNHPMCKLTGATWYTDPAGEVADTFIDWITSNKSHIADLEKFGLRPYNLSADTSGETILNLENGCVADIQPSKDSTYRKPATDTSLCMMQEFAEKKKPLRLYVLLDTSSVMQEPPVGDGDTRWAAVISALPTLPTRLADSSEIFLSCLPAERFDFTGLSCSGGTGATYPNGTLETSRNKIVNYFSSQLGIKSDDEINLFIGLNKTYNFVQEVKMEDTLDEYRYVILVVSHQDSEKIVDQKTNANSLLENIGLSFDPNQIAIYSVLYYGESSSTSGITLSTIASRTNGQFITARDDIENKLIEFAYYF